MGARAGLVEVRDRRRCDAGLNVVEEGLQVSGAADAERGQRPARHARADPVAQKLGGAGVGQMLVGDQVEAQRPQARPLLHRCRDALGKHAACDMPAAALTTHADVLGDAQPDLGKIEDLTRNPAQRRPDQRLVTALATLGNMHHDLVGHRAPRQMAASMTVLTARLTT